MIPGGTRLPLVVCPACGGVRKDLGGPHAVHYNGAGQRVDCIGRPAPVEPRRVPPGFVNGVDVPTVQEAQLDRVCSRIAAAIVGFAVAGRQFRADELRQHVKAECGELAPGSADRVLRDLRKRGLVNYRCINRKDSLYEVVAL